MRILFSLIFTFLVITTATFAQGNLDGWEHLKKEKFEIQYPANWELNEEGLMGTSLILLSLILHQDDAFRENVNLLIQDLSSYPMNLDEYAKLSTSQIETMIEDGVLISSEKIKGELYEYQKVHYTGK